MLKEGVLLLIALFLQGQKAVFTGNLGQLHQLFNNGVRIKLIVEGIMSIQAGANPKFLREKLMTFMESKKRIEDSRWSRTYPYFSAC